MKTFFLLLALLYALPVFPQADGVHLDNLDFLEEKGFIKISEDERNYIAANLGSKDLNAVFTDWENTKQDYHISQM